jgi:hypothetical protein
MPYSITREDPERDLRALRAVLSGFPLGISSSAIPALQELADSIEEQVEKIDPVEALVQEYARRDWDATSADEDSTTWRYFITPSRLREFAAEVLRIGVGEAAEQTVGITLGSDGTIDDASAIRSLVAHGYTEEQAVEAVRRHRLLSPRFCTLTQNCRLADGHADGCTP